MKIQCIFNILLIAISTFMLNVDLALSQTNENIHIITRPTDSMEFRLYNPPENFLYIKNFPIEVLKNDTDIVNIVNNKAPERRSGDNYYTLELKTGNEENIKLIISYSIFTNIADEELMFIENVNWPYLSDHYYNVIDLLQVKEMLNFGDNCFFRHDHMGIGFLRNNIQVSVQAYTADIEKREKIEKAVISLSRKIDNAIINAPKFNDPKSISAPIIKSVEILEGAPIAGKYMKLQITASDPDGGKLYYKPYNKIFMDSNIFNFMHEKTGLDSILIWVKNEDNIWSLFRKEVTF